MVLAKVVLIRHAMCVGIRLARFAMHTYYCNCILFDPGTLRTRQDFVHGYIRNIMQLIQLLQPDSICTEIKINRDTP